MMIKNSLFILIILVTGIIFSAPVSAGTQYLSGSPELAAYISGANEFSPNSETQITIIIQNTGQSQDKLVQSALTDLDDLPTTAKYLTATLTPGNAPLKVKTDPQMVGDLAKSATKSAQYTIKINDKAAGGTYTLPLSLNYTYLASTSQFNMDTIEYRYQSENILVNIPIIIKSEALIDIQSAIPEHLNAGSDGYINLKLKNTGSASGSKAVVVLTRNGNSPIIPVDDSVYIGDFPAGGVASARYKVTISKNAEKQSYPTDVTVKYLNAEGDQVSTNTETIGVPVSGKADFAIISPPAEMHPGNKKSITVEYKNTGDTPIYSARARISAVDPFTSNSDIAYIGDLQPNESRTVTYELAVDRSATIKEYGLDSEIRYRDSLDNTYISDLMKVNVDVTSTTGAAVILTNPIYLSIIAAAIIGIAYLVLHYRRKKQ